MINREIESNIRDDFDSRKAIVLIGARQVGKTTLVEAVAKDSGRVLALNCDNVDDRMNLENKTSTELQNLIAGYDLVVIDEAQRVANIGLTIKMMVDLAKAFNQGVGFAIGLLLLPFVFNLILAFGGAQYMDGSFANTQPDMVEDVVNKARDAVSGDQNDR